MAQKLLMVKKELAELFMQSLLAAAFPWDQLADFLATSSEQVGLWEIGHDLSEPQQLIEE